MLKAQVQLQWYSSSWSAGPLRARSGSQTEGRIPPKGFRAESWLDVWSSLVSFVLRCVWCGLGLASFLKKSFSFFLLNLHVGVTAVCYAGLLVCSFWASFETFIFCNVEFLHKCSKHKPSPLPSHPQSLSLTHTHQQTQPRPKTSPHPPWLPLFALPPVCCFSCWLTFLFSCSHGKPVSKQRALTVKQTA